MKINGVTVKAPQDFNVVPKDIYANKENNALGEEVKDRIRTKRVISCKWVFLTQTEIAAILAQTSDTYFTIEYIDPSLGTTTKTFTTEEKPAVKSKIRRSEQMWDELSMTFEER